MTIVFKDSEGFISTCPPCHFVCCFMALAERFSDFAFFFFTNISISSVVYILDKEFITISKDLM